MLGGEDARRQRPGIVVRQHRHGGLSDDRPFIHRGADEMDGAAAEPHARGQRPLMRVEAREGGEQRGVNIDLAVAPALDEPRRQDAQEPGIADKFGACLAQRGVERRLEARAVGEIAMADDHRRQAGPAGTIEADCVGAVGSGQDDLGGIIRQRAGLDQRLQVRAAPGDENADLQPVGHRAAMLRMRLPGPSPRGTTSPMRNTVSPASARQVVMRSAASAATTTAIPMPQLKVRDIS